MINLYHTVYIPPSSVNIKQTAWDNIGSQLLLYMYMHIYQVKATSGYREGDPGKPIRTEKTAIKAK